MTEHMADSAVAEHVASDRSTLPSGTRSDMRNIVSNRAAARSSDDDDGDNDASHGNAIISAQRNLDSEQSTQSATRQAAPLNDTSQATRANPFGAVASDQFARRAIGSELASPFGRGIVGIQQGNSSEPSQGVTMADRIGVPAGFGANWPEGSPFTVSGIVANPFFHGSISGQGSSALGTPSEAGQGSAVGNSPFVAAAGGLTSNPFASAAWRPAPSRFSPWFGQRISAEQIHRAPLGPSPFAPFLDPRNQSSQVAQTVEADSAPTLGADAQSSSFRSHSDAVAIRMDIEEEEIGRASQAEARVRQDSISSMPISGRTTGSVSLPSPPQFGAGVTAKASNAISKDVCSIATKRKAPSDPGEPKDAKRRSSECQSYNEESIAACLECPVCFENPMLPPIRQCENGHVLCDSCSSRCSECPQCRARPRDFL
jgi:hypothetical protein